MQRSLSIARQRTIWTAGFSPCLRVPQVEGGSIGIPGSNRGTMAGPCPVEQLLRGEPAFDSARAVNRQLITLQKVEIGGIIAKVARTRSNTPVHGRTERMRTSRKGIGSALDDARCCERVANNHARSDVAWRAGTGEHQPKRVPLKVSGTLPASAPSVISAQGEPTFHLLGALLLRGKGRVS
jgi:hypothetical protein